MTAPAPRSAIVDNVAALDIGCSLLITDRHTIPALADSTVWHYGRNSGKAFTTCMEDNGVRVWRVK